MKEVQNVGESFISTHAVLMRSPFTYWTATPCFVSTLIRNLILGGSLYNTNHLDRLRDGWVVVNLPFIESGYVGSKNLLNHLSVT